MTSPKQVELWRLSQAAFDEGRSPADDAYVLDLVLADPGLMETLDEVLLVESKLDALSALPVQVAPKPTSKLAAFSRVRFGTVAAALLLAGLSFWGAKSSSHKSSTLASVSEPLAHSSTSYQEQTAMAPIGVASLDSERNDPLATSSIPPKVPSISSIISFELSVSETAHSPRVRETESLLSEPRPQIQILSSTRTKIGLGERTR